MRVTVKQNLKIGVQPPNLGVGEGRIFRQARARRRLVAKLYYVGQPDFLQLLGNRLPYNIFPPWAKTPESFSPRAGQTRLNFRKFRFFSDIWGGALPTGRSMGAMSRMLPVVLRTDNKCSKFQLPEILSSGDIGRQTWHRVIWPENRREKTKSLQ